MAGVLRIDAGLESFIKYPPQRTDTPARRMDVSRATQVGKCRRDMGTRLIGLSACDECLCLAQQSHAAIPRAAEFSEAPIQFLEQLAALLDLTGFDTG